MGLFKQMKDMKGMVENAPGQIRQARALGAQAQEMAEAQRAAAAATMGSFSTATVPPPAAGGTASREPIAGVSLELYAEISKGLAAYNYDQSRAAEIAASHGIAPDAWQQAVDGWNARMQQDRTVGQEFNRLYTGR